MAELGTMTARQVRDEIAAGRLSSVEATRFSLDAITRLNGTGSTGLHAYNSVFADRAMERARAMDAARANGKPTGLLHGVPISIKDNMCTTFGTTTCSSKMLENFHAPYNATVVEKLEAAGAVILGKTNLDEFAMGSSTENSAFGPSRNPWNSKCVPGGSSGGAAASCAARMGFGGLGSDTGGSIRQPASLCGIVGLKPTYGLVSRYGLVAFASSLDQIGPMTLTVEDAAIFLQVLAGHDPKDSTSWPEAVPDYLGELDTPMKGLRIGLPREYFNVEGMEPEVKAAVLAATEWYKSQGATLVDVSLPYTKYGIAAYYIIAPAEASSNLARYDGVHYGYRTAKPQDLIDLYAASRGEGFGAEVKRRIMLGTYALSAGYADKFYLQALKVRALIKKDFDNAFEKCDVIAGPTSPTVAFEFGSKTDNPLQMYLCDVFTVTCNIAGIAGLSLPCGFSSSGLPIGMQLLGPTFSEKALLRVGRHYEKAHEWGKRKPAISA
ncbi:MAG TPA: Asp-tRNA(Asn)/Glu-tRNA(Gln) amidotransferase subunit GatA [Phycisphaerae bacterium]|jgi:aspartyl-tRNA(Asn)/glutamyl-tRNA(Gln) amidotransferase subunit A|nr:Asp-tRNA(Asn)/Glu-tRNA(Gln) amidotransferase subunit GatA [Phycisphaerae bacterium]